MATVKICLTVVVFLVASVALSSAQSGDQCEDQPDGTPCDDNNVQTFQDVCLNGTCVGTCIPPLVKINDACVVLCPALQLPAFANFSDANNCGNVTVCLPHFDFPSFIFGVTFKSF